MPQFPTSTRPQIDEGKPKLQGADLEAHKQLEDTESSVLDPETGKPEGPTSIYEYQRGGQLELDHEDPAHPTPNRPAGRLGI